MTTRILSFVQALFRPQDTDGPILSWAKDILGALLILAFFWLLAQLVVLALNKWGKRFTALTSTDLDDRVLQRVTPHVSRILVTLGIYLAVSYLPLPAKLDAILSGLLFVAMVSMVFNLVYSAFDELLQWYMAGREGGGDALISRHMVPIAKKVAMLFLAALALIIILKHFHYDIVSLVTALGIGSLAFGMAAKDTLAHMISGFTLMLDQPFRIGDRIQLASGQVGNVADIGLRSTRIRTPDNKLMIIPNSDLCNTTLINQDLPDVSAKGGINLGVAYGSDVDRVKEIMVAAALEVEDVLHDPAPVAFFVSFDDLALRMSLFFWVEGPAVLAAATDKINTLIIRRFNENGIEIPFPIRTVIMEKGTN